MLAPVNEETVDSKQWLVHFEAAQQALQDRNFKVARDHLVKVVSLLENEPSSLILLARCESQLNRIEDGLASLTKAVNAGWEDFRQLETEVDLARLRESPSFSRIVQQARENFDRSYLIIDGSLAERNGPAPLVLLLHGRGELPHMQARIWEEAAKANGWILVVPKGVRRLGPVYAWEKVGATETWQVARAEILRRCQKYHADIQKSHAIGPCIVAGFSQGGVAALEVLNGNPETIRGAVLFASAFPTAEQEPAYLLTFRTPKMKLSADSGIEF